MTGGIAVLRTYLFVVLSLHSVATFKENAKLTGSLLFVFLDHRLQVLNETLC